MKIKDFLAKLGLEFVYIYLKIAKESVQFYVSTR